MSYTVAKQVYVFSDTPYKQSQVMSCNLANTYEYLSRQDSEAKDHPFSIAGS